MSEEFKEELTPFLAQIQITNEIWTSGPSKDYPDKLDWTLTIPKISEDGFDIKFYADADAVYPQVADFYLIPLDTIGGKEVLWCKRFLLSALSQESRLHFRVRDGKVLRRTLKYCDPLFDRMVSFSSPLFLFKFWLKAEDQYKQNRRIDLEAPNFAKLAQDLEAQLAKKRWWKP